MKICIVHNDYGAYSGEEAVVAGQKGLLEEHGHEVCMFSRSSAEIPNMALGRLRAFLSGVFNPFSRHAFKRFLLSEKPDIVHVHNLYPLVSPSILPIAKKLGLPIVMTVHNYRLVCPNGLHFSQGEVCTKCVGGKEYWCIKRNCEESYVKSAGYALRTWWARKRRYYKDCVSVFACLTRFQADSLVKAGIDDSKINIIPNMLKASGSVNVESLGEYVGYCGRLSSEKGIEILIETARNNSEIKFVAAGNYDAMPDIDEYLPANFTLLGHCNAEQMAKFYAGARMIVLPSICFEGFPMVLLEAMLQKKAVVCSDIGGLAEIVDDGVTGLLVAPASAEDLGSKIRTLWNSPNLVRRMGIAGRKKALRDYSAEHHYLSLKNLYEKALRICSI